jgi:hypothetical protein
MDVKNNKGITGVDITISIVILGLFISLITSMFYNVTVIGKTVNRKADAVYLAVQVIEALKQIGYNELPTGEKDETSVYTLEELNEKLEEEKKITLKNGYSVSILVENYRKIKSDTTLEDILKRITVKVNYKEQDKEKSVELNTVIVNEEEV